MKIKTQFLFLFLGIVVVPLLSFAALMVIGRLQRPREEESLSIYGELRPYLNEEFSPEEAQTISFYLARRRPGTQVSVFRGDRRILYSTLGDFVPGETMQEGALFSLLREPDPRFNYILESFPRRSENPFFILQRIDHVGDKPPPRVSPFTILLVIILFLLVFVVVTTFFIARSISRGVLFLEEETRRIARGELDHPVKINGANEITALSLSLDSMRLSLKEARQRRSRFIMGISHDLKTPLALIKGYTEAISDGVADDPASRSHSLMIIASKVDQLEMMIDDLINFVRLDSEDWRNQLSPVRLGELVKTLSEQFQNDAELLGRRVAFHIPPAPEIMVPLDQRLFLRALGNLVANALRFTGPGGLIEITCRREGNRALITVEDDGPGINPRDLPHIFDIFYRGSSSRREQGLGLGLAVVKQVAEYHNWQVSADNRPGGPGACFQIAIPLPEIEPPGLSK
ncbi:MAG: HAMP domain-containing histidine kinase [Spirochaetales bacterium]|jgi:signal transduction histidine kinase|nr:HAMP domain-containing histidine kinase [Spirochaetales bacterium]